MPFKFEMDTSYYCKLCRKNFKPPGIFHNQINLDHTINLENTPSEAVKYIKQIYLSNTVRLKIDPFTNTVIDACY